MNALFALMNVVRCYLNPNNQVRTKIMQSLLFTELTAIEEANLSGGKNVIKIKSKVVSKAIVKADDISIDDGSSFNNSSDFTSSTINATIND
ncbi:MAG: hypothetical protein V7K89_20725 [Nostoc sp.]|uniref:hypothetical protein n=1 Tax=Nostoc sp. TaxID=1180 RepID=UPI002FF8599E